MTNDSASPSLPPSSPARWRIPLAVGAAVVAIIVVTAVVVGGGDDEPTPGADDSTTSTPTSEAPSAPEPGDSSPSDPTSGSASAEPSVEPTDADPTPSPVIDAAVKDAIKDGFPALVPSGVPAGWTVVAAAYVPKNGGRWTIVLTDPAGDPVTVTQTTAELTDLVREQLGGAAEQNGTVDLGDFGTGTWKVFTAGEQVAIATTIAKSTSAVVAGLGQDSPVELAQQLLTAEDGDMPEAG